MSTPTISREASPLAHIDLEIMVRRGGEHQEDSYLSESLSDTLRADAQRLRNAKNGPVTINNAQVSEAAGAQRRFTARALKKFGFECHIAHVDSIQTLVSCTNATREQLANVLETCSKDFDHATSGQGPFDYQAQPPTCVRVLNESRVTTFPEPSTWRKAADALAAAPDTDVVVLADAEFQKPFRHPARPAMAHRLSDIAQLHPHELATIVQANAETLRPVWHKKIRRITSSDDHHIDSYGTDAQWADIIAALRAPTHGGVVVPDAPFRHPLPRKELEAYGISNRYGEPMGTLGEVIEQCRWTPHALANLIENHSPVFTHTRGLIDSIAETAGRNDAQQVYRTGRICGDTSLTTHVVNPGERALADEALTRAWLTSDAGTTTREGVIAAQIRAATLHTMKRDDVVIAEQAVREIMRIGHAEGYDGCIDELHAHVKSHENGENPLDVKTIYDAACALDERSEELESGDNADGLGHYEFWGSDYYESDQGEQPTLLSDEADGIISSLKTVWPEIQNAQREPLGERATNAAFDATTLDAEGEDRVRLGTTSKEQEIRTTGEGANVVEHTNARSRKSAQGEVQQNETSVSQSTDQHATPSLISHKPQRGATRQIETQSVRSTPTGAPPQPPAPKIKLPVPPDIRDERRLKPTLEQEAGGRAQRAKVARALLVTAITPETARAVGENIIRNHAGNASAYASFLGDGLGPKASCAAVQALLPHVEPHQVRASDCRCNARTDRQYLNAVERAISNFQRWWGRAGWLGSTPRSERIVAELRQEASPIHLAETEAKHVQMTREITLRRGRESVAKDRQQRNSRGGELIGQRRAAARKPGGDSGHSGGLGR